MDYKEKLDTMVRIVMIRTRVRVYQAREWDSPWYKGVYYGPIIPNPSAIITVQA